MEKYTVNVNHSVTMRNYPMQKKLFRRRKANVKEILAVTFLYVIPAIIIAWFLLSWANIVSNNLTTFEYAWWNAFRLFGLR